MATNSRSGQRGGNRRRNARKNNNPEGRNQYSRSPLIAAATVGGAVAAGVFLWSRRDQIGEQIGNLATQIGEWRDGMASDTDGEFDGADSDESFAGTSGSTAQDDDRTQAEIAEEALTLKTTGETV